MAATVAAAITTTWIVPRPTGFEVDDVSAVTLPSSIATTRKMHSNNIHAGQHASIRDYYHARKNEPKRPCLFPAEESSSTSSSSSRTFYYTGQGPAKCIYNRMLYGRVVIAASVTDILPDCFANWTSLHTILFEYPSQCTSIGDSAFAGCTSLRALDEDTLPDSLQIIGANGTSKQKCYYILL